MRTTSINGEGSLALSYQRLVAPRSAQISVRWKFLCDRDGVGPRWPW
jgi:hypothetical protein